jgi:hypothetical protein
MKLIGLEANALAVRYDFHDSLPEGSRTGDAGIPHIPGRPGVRIKRGGYDCCRSPQQERQGESCGPEEPARYARKIMNKGKSRSHGSLADIHTSLDFHGKELT